MPIIQFNFSAIFMTHDTPIKPGNLIFLLFTIKVNVIFSDEGSNQQFEKGKKTMEETKLKKREDMNLLIHNERIIEATMEEQNLYWQYVAHGRKFKNTKAINKDT